MGYDGFWPFVMLVVIVDILNRRLSIPVHGMVALPQLSMTGAKWARLEKDVRVPAFMQVAL